MEQRDLVAGEIYSGNDLSISHRGYDWTIWRYCEDERVERITLTREGMDELAAYFGAFYEEDKT